jgi:hypothetical protein
MDLRQLINAVSAQALGMAYYVRLGRELGVVDSILTNLTYDECCQVNAQLSKSIDRNEIVAVREEAFTRARSDSSVMRRTGLAQWLATAFLETRDIDNDGIRERHKQIQLTIRGLQKRAEPKVRKVAVAV